MHKGLTIVLLPLMLNLILVFVLDNALARAAHSMELSRQNCLLITGLAQCICDTSVIVGVGGNAMMFSSVSTAIKNLDNLFNQLDSRLTQLQSHATDNDDLRQLHTEIKALIARQRAMFLNSDKVVAPDTGLIVKLRLAREWTKAGGRESYLMQQVLSHSQDILENATKMENQSQLRAESIVAAGLAINLCLALLLVYFFHKNIASRVQVLVRNARKLPRYEEITERVRGYDELADLGHALRAASIEVSDAQEYRRSLMQMMAHDIRSPIAAGLVSVEMIERFKKDDLSLQDQNELQQMRQGLETCLGLIGDLLLLESLETGKSTLDLELENLSELTDTAMAETFDFASSRGVEIRNLVEHQYVELDRAHIIIVIKKLLQHAIKDCRLGSTIVVSGKSDGEYCRVEVNDPDAKIEPTMKENLFDSLFQLGRGAGAIEGEASLALAICKQIVVAHRGRIGAYPSARGGAVFWFDLRRAKDDSAPSDLDINDIGTGNAGAGEPHPGPG